MAENLPQGTTDMDLTNKFATFGPIENVQILGMFVIVSLVDMFAIVCFFIVLVDIFYFVVFVRMHIIARHHVVKFIVVIHQHINNTSTTHQHQHQQHININNTFRSRSRNDYIFAFGTRQTSYGSFARF